MKKIIRWVWELPQKLLALIIILFSRAEFAGEYKEARLYFWKWSGGMSLSTYIFLPFDELEGTEWEEEYIKHEYGHTRQSWYLGPLYLLVIGLPSLIWAGCFKSYRYKKGVSYYSFYTESWADKLGNVKRG